MLHKNLQITGCWFCGNKPVRFTIIDVFNGQQILELCSECDSSFEEKMKLFGAESYTVVKDLNQQEISDYVMTGVVKMIKDKIHPIIRDAVKYDMDLEDLQKIVAKEYNDYIIEDIIR